MEISTKGILLLGLAMAIGGCGQQALINSQAQEAKFVLERDILHCKERFPPKPILPRVRCMQDAKVAYESAKARSIGRSDLDVIEVLHAKERAIAERVDNGSITQTQAEAELAQIHFETGSIVAQRNKEVAASLAEQRRASAALFAAGAAMASPPTIVNTTCRTTMGTTHCQTR